MQKSRLIVQCDICGKFLDSNSGGVRPRSRHKECRKLDELLRWSEKLIEKK